MSELPSQSQFEASLKTANEMVDGGRLNARIYLRDAEPQLVEDLKWILETYKRLDPIDPLESFNVEGALLYILDVSGDDVKARATEISSKYGISMDQETDTDGKKILIAASDLFFER